MTSPAFPAYFRAVNWRKIAVTLTTPAVRLTRQSLRCPGIRPAPRIQGISVKLTSFVAS